MITGMHRLRRNIMEDNLAWLAAALLLLQIIGAHEARAATTSPATPAVRAAPVTTAPAARITGRECAAISQYAVAARTLAEARVDKDAAVEVLRRMHTNLLPASAGAPESDSRWHQFSAGIVDYAYRARSYPASFVTDFETACAAAQTAPGVPADDSFPRVSQPRIRM
jgi:hypothetical protein